MNRLLLPLLLLAGAAVADVPELKGKWTVHLSVAGYENDMPCTFNQNGTELTGSCKSQDKDVAVTGKVEEGKVTFTHKGEYEGQELTLTYTGKFESPAKVAGSLSVQPMGVDGDFTAVPVPEK